MGNNERVERDGRGLRIKAGPGEVAQPESSAEAATPPPALPPAPAPTPTAPPAAPPKAAVDVWGETWWPKGNRKKKV